MKIGFDAKRAFYNTRGLGNYARSAIGGLVSNYPQNNYYLYSPKHKGPLPFVESLNNSKTQINHRKHLLGGFWRTFQLGNQIAADRLDIYHGLSNEIPIRSPKCQTRFVVTIHDLIFLNQPKFYPWIDRNIYFQKVRFAAKHADQIVAVSKNTKSDITTHFDVDPKKISVLYPSCDEIYYKEKNIDELKKIRQHYKLPERFFLFVGALTSNKNVISILNAISSLQEPDYQLVIVGHGPEKNTLTKYCSQLHIEKQVRFISEPNKIDSDHLAGIYQLSTATILPSYYEGFGLPILESLASGTPVIASDNSSLPEVTGPGGLLVNPHKVDDLAQAMTQMHNNPELRNSLAEKGSIHARKFHPKNQTDILIQLYSQLLE